MNKSTPEVQMADAAREAVVILGGLSATARLMNVTPPAVKKWIVSKVPATRVLELERLVDARVTRYQLRPDVYGER